MNFSELVLGLATAAMAEPEILVMAERVPTAATASPVSSSVTDAETIGRLNLPGVADYLRLVPGLSVAVAGPRGSQTQVRIRGAEANHSLLFVDGIRFNDPASGNEGRFELLGSDAMTRLEVVRGPQSALWGSEAMGGVISAQTADPLEVRGTRGLAEYGSLDSLRLFGRQAVGGGSFGLVGSVGWQSSRGIDALGGSGERDGYENFTASLKARLRANIFDLHAVGHWIEGRSEFDGYDPATFLRADTLDLTENRIGALGLGAAVRWRGWDLRLDGSYLDSANRNRRGEAPLNRTAGNRLALGGQLARTLGGHRFVAAIEHQAERFAARDTVFFGGTDQDRSRNLTALVGEWRAVWTSWLTTDLAVRHDAFSAVEDATTVRAALLVEPAPHVRAHLSYGEGIAQPTFFDLFGFFPGSFTGNPDLRPERGRSVEAGLRFERRRIALGATFFSARLRDEIVDVFDPATFRSSTANGVGTSRRRGLELEADLVVSPAISLRTSYALVDSDEPGVAGGARIREVRRPRHSFGLAAHGRAGPLRWGIALSYAGPRRDVNFDVFPAQEVRLDDHLLASLNLAMRVAPQVELFGRVENGFDADYVDAVGYATPGRTVYAGLRLALGD